MCILCVYESCGQGLGTVTLFDSEKSELNLFLEIVLFKFPELHFNSQRRCVALSCVSPVYRRGCVFFALSRSLNRYLVSGAYRKVCG